MTEHVLDQFDFPCGYDDTIDNSVSGSSKTQHSDSTIFRYEGVHWRCGSCIESVRYSLVNGYVEHVRLWTCCQCKYPDNRVSLWDECSMCCGTHFLDDYVCNRPSSVQAEADDMMDERENLETSNVICAELSGLGRSFGAFATDDLVSTVRKNLVPFESFLRDERLNEGMPLECTDQPAVIGSTQHSSLDTDTAETDFPSEAELSTLYSTDEPFATYLSSNFGPTTTFPSDASMSTPTSVSSSMTTTSQTASTLTEPLRDLDSGYGSQCSTSIADRTSHKCRNDDDHPTALTAVVDEVDAPPHKKPRRRRLNPLNPGLACPFYVHNPGRCKYDSCAGPGFLGINRLKQHLERVHLYHSCERCRVPFYGNTAGKEQLAMHQRHPQPCALQTNLRPETWGVSYATFEAMRSKKGAAGKPEEERWRGIYQLIFPDAEEKEMAMPCESSGRAAFVIVVFANAGSDVSVKGMEGRHKDQIRLPAPYQALENFSRELLRILPIRLNAAFASRSEDTRLTAMWNDFANGQLHDVLRGVIAEMSSSASSLPLAEMSNKEASGGEELDDSSCFAVLNLADY